MTQAFLPMKKIDIAALQRAAEVYLIRSLLIGTVISLDLNLIAAVWVVWALALLFGYRGAGGPQA